MTCFQARPVAAPPKMNQLLRARGRHLVVTEVSKGSVDVMGDARQVQHLVELGLAVHGGPVPVRPSRHFRQLMVDGVLRAAGQ